MRAAALQHYGTPQEWLARNLSDMDDARWTLRSPLEQAIWRLAASQLDSALRRQLADGQLPLAKRRQLQRTLLECFDGAAWERLATQHWPQRKHPFSIISPLHTHIARLLKLVRELCPSLENQPQLAEQLLQRALGERGTCGAVWDLLTPAQQRLQLQLAVPLELQEDLFSILPPAATLFTRECSSSCCMSIHMCGAPDITMGPNHHYYDLQI
jgi:hypothetical protein